ncbi:STAS/SEC14 domain-containing protein [Croceibacterium aestuarii]|uniref:STAS/SEC14 domain-containing protein n=1 Tax=Croceibacterium aestuarii TaxID=3064139 RepID=UPI00272DD0DC|nr:STAS/SEC14 domain-containing protein [Croceibacterium sp. D39]
MIEIDLSDSEIVTLRPHGRLSEEDFTNLAKAIDERINETDRVPNLVIRVDGLPHWDSIGALARHFHFVQVHQKVVRKVAIVGDSPLLAFAPEIADHFVAARIRRFPAGKLAEAQAWARAEGDDSGHFEEIEGLPRDVIALRAVGVITGDDYRDTLMPMVEERLKTHDKLKCLIVLGEEYATYTGDAAWADLRLGLSHWNTFTRMALVTDIGWMAKAARLFSPLMPLEVEVFGLDAIEDAKSWIKR